MLNKFQKQISKNYNFIQNEGRLLLAISGGIDSMVLLDLMKKSKFEISVAHCNFCLRGQESDSDESFVVEYCKQNNIPLFVKQFDTERYASENKKSIQISARELRYDWFFELKEKYHFDYIVTAHHLNDSLETFFINLSRGTGIEGLTGIRENEDIIRPMLQFTRSEIEKYALEHNIKWREDSSNASDKYLRNKIRHNIVPCFEEINPDFLNSFSKTINYLRKIQAFSDEVFEEKINKILLDSDVDKRLDITELKSHSNYKYILYKWLSKYGFTAWEDIYELVNAQTGKFIESEEFILLKNRNELILTEKNKENLQKEFQISEVGKIDFPIRLELSEVVETSGKNDSNIIYVDKNLLKLPLKIGKWQEGEYFYPFGMQGKSKKVSKFFKDEKLSIFDKNNAWILYSGNQIVWIIGMRQDERFKVTKNTTSIIKIEYLL